MAQVRVTLRFFEELNDFLPPSRRHLRFEWLINGPSSIKDVIEALGLPHPEVELILVNGRSVKFSHPVADGDDVSVYPMFETLDVTPLLRLRPRPLRVTRFVLDAHLGTLARYLRALGFDTLYRNDYTDAALARISHDERRVLLTRDVGLLKRSLVTRGCYLRATEPRRQLEEIVDRLDLYRSVRPFRRCVRCNGPVRAVARSRLEGRIKPAVLRAFRRFSQCTACGRIYWPGSHYQRMRTMIDEVLQRQGSPGR